MFGIPTYFENRFSSISELDFTAKAAARGHVELRLAPSGGIWLLSEFVLRTGSTTLRRDLVFNLSCLREDCRVLGAIEKNVFPNGDIVGLQIEYRPE